jgi:hypothetical protein
MSAQQSAMKVQVTVTVEIDPQAWADEYGSEIGNVRADVKRYAAQIVQQHFDSVGVLA